MKITLILIALTLGVVEGRWRNAWMRTEMAIQHHRKMTQESTIDGATVHVVEGKKKDDLTASPITIDFVHQNQTASIFNTPTESRGQLKMTTTPLGFFQTTSDPEAKSTVSHLGLTTAFGLGSFAVLVLYIRGSVKKTSSKVAPR